MGKGMIERAKGGRPKAAEMWEHVRVLAGNKKKVKCKHCGFEFAASANRIKYHIQQITGQGIRPCPNPKKNIKEDLHDSSQGPRDNKEVNERVLDCYMSPKRMWKGIMDLQQEQIPTKHMHQAEKIKVGPFYVSSTVHEQDLQLMQYVFENSSETIFSSRQRFYLSTSEFTTFKPKAFLDSFIIDTFACMLTETERKKHSKPLNWYLPLMFSSAARSGDVNSFLDVVERHKISENYMFGNLEYCEKIFIPIHVEKNSCGHYYLYIIHMKNKKVEIWDSLCDRFMNKTERDQITQKLLLAMEKIFKNVMFSEFYRVMASNILLQPNGYDCGIFVINYMQQSDNYTRQNPLFQFDSDKERLDLAFKLLKSDINEEKEKLYANAARSYANDQSEEDLDSSGSNTKHVDTSKTIGGYGERGGYMELDESNNRVKRKNVALKTAQVVELRKENSALIVSLHIVKQGYENFEAENSTLRTHVVELENRLQFLNEIIDLSNAMEAFDSAVGQTKRSF